MNNSTANFVAAAKPPEGWIPDFIHPKDVYHTTDLAVQALSLVVMTFFFAIRVYVKMVIKRGEILLEDWFCAASWILTMALGMCYLMMTYHGEGYHLWEISENAFQRFVMWLYISSTMYIPASFATKVSLLLMIARVFSVHQRVSVGLRVLCAGFAVMYLPVQCLKILVCKPLSVYWTDTFHMAVNGVNPHCINQGNLFTADMVLAILADTIILVIPVPLTLTMRLPGRVRLRIIFMLSVGGSALGMLVFKAYRTYELLPSDDITVSFSTLSILSLLEPVIGNICACLPSLNIFLEKLLGQRSSANAPRSRSFIRWLQQSISSITTSSLSFDFWSKVSPESKAGRDETNHRTRNGASERKEEADALHHCHLLELPCRVAYRHPSLSFTACGFAELGEASSVRTNMVKEIVVGGEKVDDEGEVTYPSEIRKAKSWDGVVSVRVEKWNPAGLGPLESLNNQTTVRIKWLGSASH